MEVVWVSLNGKKYLAMFLQHFIVYLFLPNTYESPLEGKWAAVFLLPRSTVMCHVICTWSVLWSEIAPP